tara:strand:- start:389 stop:598 length:210 start_codon:yes stop_codon:yes gene_type:complete
VKILKSVGCAISSDGMTYALNDDGKIEYFTDVHLDDCSIEWYDRLSFEDRLTVLKIERSIEDEARQKGI